jgi:hypothetical protein
LCLDKEFDEEMNQDGKPVKLFETLVREKNGLKDGREDGFNDGREDGFKDGGKMILMMEAKMILRMEVKMVLRMEGKMVLRMDGKMILVMEAKMVLRMEGKMVLRKEEKTLKNLSVMHHKLSLKVKNFHFFYIPQVRSYTVSTQSYYILPTKSL